MVMEVMGDGAVAGRDDSWTHGGRGPEGWVAGSQMRCWAGKIGGREVPRALGKRDSVEERDSSHDQ